MNEWQSGWLMTWEVKSTTHILVQEFFVNSEQRCWVADKSCVHCPSLYCLLILDVATLKSQRMPNLRHVVMQRYATYASCVAHISWGQRQRPTFAFPARKQIWVAIYRLLCGQLHVGHNGDLQCDFGSVCGYHHEGFVVMSDLFAATCVNFTQPVWWNPKI